MLGQRKKRGLSARSGLARLRGPPEATLEASAAKNALAGDCVRVRPMPGVTAGEKRRRGSSLRACRKNGAARAAKKKRGLSARGGLAKLRGPPEATLEAHATKNALAGNSGRLRGLPAPDCSARHHLRFTVISWKDKPLHKPLRIARTAGKPAC